MERQGSKLGIVTISYVPSVLIGEVLRDCAFCTVELGIKFINTSCSSGCVYKPINSGIFFFLKDKLFLKKYTKKMLTNPTLL